MKDMVEKGERPGAGAWMESERAYCVRREAENRAAWHEYHRAQAERHRRNLGALVARHEEATERLQATGERRTA